MSAIQILVFSQFYEPIVVQKRNNNTALLCRIEDNNCLLYHYFSDATFDHLNNRYVMI